MHDAGNCCNTLCPPHTATGEYSAVPIPRSYPSRRIRRSAHGTPLGNTEQVGGPQLQSPHLLTEVLEQPFGALVPNLPPKVLIGQNARHTGDETQTEAERRTSHATVLP